MFKNQFTTLFMHFIALQGVFLATPLFALGGMTGDKVSVPYPFVLEKDAVEMEMSFSLFRATARFNDYGHLKDLPGDYDKIDPLAGEDRVFSENGVAFRVSGGIRENLELTLAYGHQTTRQIQDRLSFTHFDDVEVLLKYYLGETGEFSFALMGGAYYDTDAWTPDYHLGGIASYRPFQSSGITFDLEFWGSRSAIRTIEYTRTHENGYGFAFGAGYSFGKLTPSIELRYEDSIYKQYRLHRAGRIAEINMNLSPEEAEIDLLPHVASHLGTTLPAGWDAIREQYHLFKERIDYRERAVSVNMGINYDWNDHASTLIAYSQEVDGINTFAGKTISLAFSWSFDSASDENARNQTEPREGSKE